MNNLLSDRINAIVRTSMIIESINNKWEDKKLLTLSECMEVIKAADLLLIESIIMYHNEICKPNKYSHEEVYSFDIAFYNLNELTGKLKNNALDANNEDMLQ